MRVRSEARAATTQRRSTRSSESGVAAPAVRRPARPAAALPMLSAAAPRDAERQADAVGDAVASSLDGTSLDAAPEARGGSPGGLPPHLLAFFEGAFSQDFSQVRVHDDIRGRSAASSFDALAVTRGDDIYFAPDAYEPSTRDGQRLLAHELTHVVQQRAGGVRVQAKPAGRGPAKHWGTPLPGLEVPAHRDAVRGIHDWEKKYATAGSASNKNVFYVGQYTLQQICTYDDRGEARVHVYFTSVPGSDDYTAVGPDSLGTFVMLYGAGMIAAKESNTPQLETSTPIIDPRKLPMAADAYIGPGHPELFYLAPRLPVSDEKVQAFHLDYYLMEAHLRHLPDGGKAVLFYVALNPSSLFRAEFVISPRILDAFAKNIGMYENLAVLCYPMEPGTEPAAYSVYSQRFVAGVMAGDVERAKQGTDAWTAAAKDPTWWLQVLMGYASAATPAPSVRAPSLSIVRSGPVATGGGASTAVGGNVVASPITPRISTGGGGWRSTVSSGGQAAAVAVAETAPVAPPVVVAPPASRPVGVPGFNPKPVPVRPRVKPPSAAAAAAVVGAAAAASPSAAPAPAPAPAEKKEDKKKAGVEKVADSGIFMDRVEEGAVQRTRIDRDVLARADLTLHVPDTAYGEATRMDPHGTQATRLAGAPGGARILRDVDGNIEPLRPNLARIVSNHFGESDLRIALRARERGVPLITTNRRMVAQVRDGNFPERVRALAGVVVEVA